MNTPSTSTEIAIPSTQTLCEHIISQKGITHDKGRITADWRVFQPDSEMRVHLHQLRGIGANAIYLIRTETTDSQWVDSYIYNCETGVTAQSINLQGNTKTATSYLEVSWSRLAPLRDVNQLLFDGIAE